MINKLIKSKFLIITLIFLNNCSVNSYSNLNDSDLRNNRDFSYKNSYVSCGSSNYYLYNNYSYQTSEYNFRCRNSWQNKNNYGYFDPKNKKWVYAYAK